MTETSPRVFLRISDVYGLTDDELRAVFGDQLNVVGITRGSPSVEYVNEECAVVTLRGDRRSIKTQVERQFKAFRHPECEPYPDFDFKGFTPLTNGQFISDEKNIIDVIAVAGLGGNAFATWQGDKVLHRSHWLRDFLPMDIENVRVWIYGYKSDLSDGDNTAGTLHYANLLRDELVTTAERYNMKNIVLMGHSLGCILIKKALVDLPIDHEFFGCLVTLVFFGAPHRGLEITALSDYAFTMLKQQRIQTMIAELGSDSAFLESLNNDFIARLDTLPHIVTVFESRKTPTLVQDLAAGKWTRTGPPVLAVSKVSAQLGLPTKYETTLEAPYDHSGVAKVTKDPDHVYRRLVGVLNRLIKRRNAGSASATSAGSSAVTNTGSVFTNMSSTQNLLLHDNTSNTTFSNTGANQWPAGKMDTIVALPDNSWTQVPPGSVAQQTAALFQAMRTNAFGDPRRLSFLANSRTIPSQALPSRARLIPEPPESPAIGRVQTLSPSTSFESSLSSQQSQSAAEPAQPAQRPLRRAPPPPPPRRTSPSALSAIYPGPEIRPQQNNPFLKTGSAVSLPESIPTEPSIEEHNWPQPVPRPEWPEAVERDDQPELVGPAVTSLPFITFRQAPTSQDYMPFQFDRTSRFLHDSALVVTMKRYFSDAVWDSESVEPIMLKSDVISDPHCECFYSNGQWFIRDLGSTNGTWLNGWRLSDSTVVSPRHALHDGDLVKLGSQIGQGRFMRERCVRLVVDFSDE